MLVVGATLLLALTGLGGCGDGPSTEPPAGIVAGLVTQGPGTEDLLVHGTVTRDGAPVEGSAVTLMLRPTDLGDAEAGEVIDTFETDPVRTDGDGRYEVRLDPGSLESKYLPAGERHLNFELSVWDGAATAVWNSTVWLVDGRVWRTDRAGIGDPAYDMSFDLGTLTITTTGSDGEVEVGTLSMGEFPGDATESG